MDLHRSVTEHQQDRHGPCTQQIVAGGSKVTQTIKLASSPCVRRQGPAAGLSVRRRRAERDVVHRPVPRAVAGLDHSGRVHPGADTGEHEGIQGLSSPLGAPGAKKSAVKLGRARRPISQSAARDPSSLRRRPATAPAVLHVHRRTSGRSRSTATSRLTCPATRRVVTGPNGGGLNESATYQCEGLYPGCRIWLRDRRSPDPDRPPAEWQRHVRRQPGQPEDGIRAKPVQARGTAEDQGLAGRDGRARRRQHRRRVHLRPSAACNHAATASARAARRRSKQRKRSHSFPETAVARKRGRRSRFRPAFTDRSSSMCVWRSQGWWVLESFPC